MSTTPSKNNYLPLDAAAAYLHVSVERLARLKELKRLTFYQKNSAEGEYCKLSELKNITHADIMDAIYGLLGDEDSEEGTMLEFESGGGRR